MSTNCLIEENSEIRKARLEIYVVKKYLIVLNSSLLLFIHYITNYTVWNIFIFRENINKSNFLVFLTSLSYIRIFYHTLILHTHNLYDTVARLISVLPY